MTLFIQQVVEGLASGAIYASLALALVLIYRSTGVLNFAQGEMATFSAFIAWQLTQWGLGIWPALLVTLVISFAMGAAIERTAIRPLEGGEPLALLIVTLGLFFAFNSLALWIWGSLTKRMPALLPSDAVEVGGVTVGLDSLLTLVVVLGVAAALFALFSYTRVGLAMRAAAGHPEESRFVAVPVERMLMLGWGLAAAVGALAAILIAPVLQLEPNMMQGVLIYAFAAAALGGLDSAGGAIAGGLVVGVSQNLASTYVDFIGTQLSIVVPFAIIVVVLLLRPAGLFGRVAVMRA
jgi:branched-chain amino acid transport system permease protein